MDCHSETTTLDLCSEPDCVTSTVAFGAATGGLEMHLPNHGMFKVHRIIFDRDTGWIERTAYDALDCARGTLSGLKKEENLMPVCVRCKTAISLPCWYCVECTGECGSSAEPSWDIMNPYFSARQGRGSSATTVNTSSSLSTKRTPRCIQS